MAYQIKDTSGEIETGSIYLPKAGVVYIGTPLVGIQTEALKAELNEFYGDLYLLEEITEAVDEGEKKPELDITTQPVKGRISKR